MTVPGRRLNEGLMRVLALILLTLGRTTAFVVTKSAQRWGPLAMADTAFTPSAAGTAADNKLSLSLKKPLGLILEEVEEGAAAGVFVSAVGDSGSAVAWKDQLVNARLVSVMGTPVTASTFDAVMDLLVNAPETVELEFVVPETLPEMKQENSYEIGTSVSITVKQDGKNDLVLQAAVGDNLRQVLLQNNFELYQGLKQKLGNCGGGGQCTFCAVDFLQSDGWLERSDYEDSKLKKFPDARLACLNNIQGPATIQKTKR